MTIQIHNCKIKKDGTEKVSSLSWTFEKGENWLILGANGSGKSDFIQALSNTKGYEVEPLSNDGLYANGFTNSITMVSLETAASLIEEERVLDEGDYCEGGVDIGRTGAAYIGEVLKPEELRQLCGKAGDILLEADKRGIARPKTLPKEGVEKLSLYPEVQLCGISAILDRGLKYLSTGEIRRTLLCRALLSRCNLLILSDPFAGLDVQSRTILMDFFAMVGTRKGQGAPGLLLSMERYTDIPDSISHVLEFTEGRVSFEGTKTAYEAYLLEKNTDKEAQKEKERKEFITELEAIYKEPDLHIQQPLPPSVPLVEMKKVTVGWGEKKVLSNLSWTLMQNKHWLIRGPNGSGKTTFLELITGDNMQVFSNDVSIFGRRRGTGETIWELKARMGIVSYRLHLEYRMVGGTDLEAVLLSGFHDSIGLYEQRSPVEQMIAKKWLKLASFEGREKDSFSSLSYGEQRAILILRAAIKRPALLILDEPCHGLDEENRRKILHLLDMIAATGTTTLLHVTHDPTEVLSCEKHILELHPTEEPMYQIINI